MNVVCFSFSVIDEECNNFVNFVNFECLFEQLQHGSWSMHILKWQFVELSLLQPLLALLVVSSVSFDLDDLVQCLHLVVRGDVQSAEPFDVLILHAGHQCN